MNEISPDLLASIAGAALSLAMSYIPGLNGWFNKLTGNGKRIFMALLLAGAALSAALWSCSNPDDTALFSCLGGLNWKAYLSALFYALVANQSTYSIAGEGNKDD